MNRRSESYVPHPSPPRWATPDLQAAGHRLGGVVEFVCCLLSAVGGVWLLASLYRSSRRSRQAAGAGHNDRAGQAEGAGQAGSGTAATAEPQFAAPDLAPWPVCESVRYARDWLAAVAGTARAADRTGAPVRLADIEVCLSEGWRITTVITGRIDALRHTRGADWHALPPETRHALAADDERLRRLGHALASLREDLTNATAATGWGQAHRLKVLDDDIRAVGDALRQFPADLG